MVRRRSEVARQTKRWCELNLLKIAGFQALIHAEALVYPCSSNRKTTLARTGWPLGTALALRRVVNETSASRDMSPAG
jgi:hypothetical protein